MVAFRNKWSGRPPRGPNIWIYREMGRYSWVFESNCQNQSVTPKKRFSLMGTRTCANPYCILLLWWHSVTNGLGVPHGVPTYGYIQKWEDFPVVCENNCQNESVSTNTYNSNGCKNLCYSILYLTIMVAFRNKWSGGTTRGPNVWIHQEIGDFPVGSYREQLLK